MNRSTGLKRTPFLRDPESAPLGRNVPLRSVSRITASRGPDFPAAESGVPATIKNAARKTGNSGPTPEVRALVLERDGYACVCCGKSVIGQRYSLGHRLRASHGGKPVPSNLLTFLGLGGEQHHGRIDRRDDPEDENRGLTVRSWQDPAQVPVTVIRPDGSRFTGFAWDDGRWHDEPEQAVAA